MFGSDVRVVGTYQCHTSRTADYPQLVSTLNLKWVEGLVPHMIFRYHHLKLFKATTGNCDLTLIIRLHLVNKCTHKGWSGFSNTFSWNFHNKHRMWKPISRQTNLVMCNYNCSLMNTSVSGKNVHEHTDDRTNFYSGKATCFQDKLW